MKKWTKTYGLLFMAAASVYCGQGVVAAPGKQAPAVNGGKSPATDVRLLEELLPAANGAANAPADGPATTTTTAVPATPADKPAPVEPARHEGRSVSKSEVAVSDEGTVEIHVNDANLVEVLRMLSLQSQKNIICSKDVRGTVTANLYNVTIREALDQILHMNGYAYREKGNFINVYTVKELQAVEEAERRTTTEIFRLHYTPAANALTMIKPVMSTAGQASATTPALAGISAGGQTGGNDHAVEDMIVVTDFPENLERVRKILKDVDRRPQQVLVEAVILRAALSEDNALGVDFNVLAGVRFTDLTSKAGQITGATSANTTVNGNAGSVGTGNSFAGSVPGGFKVGFVSDNVSIFLSALEGVTDTTVLANPKILALNKQKGEVIVGRKDGYLTTTVTESATVQTVEFLDTGTRLIFRPYIGDDGFVRMELHPEDSSGGLTGANLPFKITTELTSNIMVKDGHTIVIGGLFRESSDVAKSQTPFLGNLPLAGPLFRNQRDRTTREEIIILLTPHIIKDDAEFAKLSTDEAKRMEQLRVGTRKGMMPWGRERLAETAYEAAVAEMNKATPDTQKALWHLDCATNLNPKFVEAIEMKQRLTGRVLATSDNSTVRSFVKQMVLLDRAPAAAPADPAAPPTRTGDHAPAQPAAPQASTGNATPEPLADATDPEAAPADDHPDADRVLAGADKAVVAGPATRPAKAAVVAAAPATRPTTQPVVADAVVDLRKADEAPAQAPTPARDLPPTVTVTELPLEEVKPDAPSVDDNK